MYFSHLLLQGEMSFFLQPGEWLENGIQDTYILSEDEGLLLRALRPLEDENEVRLEPLLGGEGAFKTLSLPSLPPLY